MKHFISIVASLTLCVSLFADNHLNGILSSSYDPESDRIALQQIRRHLDEVRNRENRPTVALVLCGGGAKGAAEVGAMKYIEEIGIPVDFICGTSIGSLIGGMYSVGYDAYFLDSLFRRQDWPVLLTDRIASEYIPINSKLYKSRYQLAFPFQFGSHELRDRVEEHKIYDDQPQITSLLSSLPSGYVYGMNVNHMFSSYTVGYQDSISFSKLPVPFACVATELVSTKRKNFDSGELKTAMRSSMGIPGLFKPVRTDGMVLSDGGTENNFPVDIAKAVGADIIIGIDISDPLPTYDKVNNIGTILGQFLNMLVGKSHEESVEMTDIYIRPDLNGYNSLSFKSEAVDTLLHNGYEAAKAHAEELLAVKNRTKGAVTRYYGPKAINLTEEEVTISSIEFNGLSDGESRILLKKCGIDVLDAIDADKLHSALEIIQGTGAVEQVTWSLLGDKEPYHLVFNCVKAPDNRLGIGARIDTEIWAEIGLNFGWNINRLAGPKLDVNAKLGRSQSIDARFMLDYPSMPTFNVEASFSNVNGTLRKFNDAYLEYGNQKLDCNYMSHKEKIYISSNKWLDFDGQFGVQNKGYYMAQNRTYATLLYDEEARGNYLGLFLSGMYYTLDNRYCPTKGMELKFGADADFLKSGVKSFKPIYTVALDVKGVIPMGKRVALIPDFHYRSVFDQYSTIDFKGAVGHTVTPEFSYSHRLFIGGDIQGRYIENQVPFVGLNYITDCSYISRKSGEDDWSVTSYDHLALLNLDLRVNAAKNLYVSAQGGYVRMSTKLSNFFKDDSSRNVFGAALQVMYNTIIGPIKASVKWSDRLGNFKDDLGFYLSIGVDL